MSDTDLTSMIFPVKCITTGWLATLKKALYKMRTNVDSFSLLVFLNAGREGASLTRTDSPSGSLLEASLARTVPQSLLVHSSGSCPFITGTNLLDDDSFLSKEASVFSATHSVSGADVAMLDASADDAS